MPDLPDTPWAKLVRDTDKTVVAALPLADHCLDVAAVAEGVLRNGAWGRVLTHAAGRSLTELDLLRMVVLVALHDIGKANRGFQARWDHRAEWVGHEGEVAALLLDAGLRQTPAGQALHHIIRDWKAAPYIPALMAHHGRPRAEFGPHPATGGQNLLWKKHVQHWQSANGYDPAAAAAALLDQLRARWPLAWEPGEPLPDSPRFVALFAGLLVLADWIGSDAKRFPVAGPHGALREAMRVAEAKDAVTARGLATLDTPAGDFEAAFGPGFRPRGVQADAAADDLGAVALIEAETGSGKTEAALWRWLELRRRGAVDGLFFALPTRSAAVQLHTRVNRMLRRVWGDAAPEAVLAVPGYLQAGDAKGQALPGWEVRWDDRDSADDSRWAAEQSNRYLAARIAVGTIDQALLGALRVKHAPVRAAALARSLLVVDEVHASDAYMGGLLERLLDNHVAAGGQALLLSATLGATARARFLKQTPLALAEAITQPYPALSGRGIATRPTLANTDREKRVTIDVSGEIANPQSIAERAVEAARAGASVLVVRNSVGGAVAVAQAVEALAPDLAFRVDGVATLHHGRFAPDDRRLLDTTVDANFGNNRTTAGRILVGTQTLEQSLDIDADLLITDLAPMDVLLQRIGRLHRHAGRDRGAFADARVIVLRPADRDLTPLLGPVRERHGLGPTKHGRGPYPNLLQLEATLRLLETNPVVTIPTDNRRLVENALHPEVLDAIAEELGTAWQNHAADCAGVAHADRGTAKDLSLDLSMEFRKLSFPDNAEVVATRLGARDLLVDLDTPLDGPFGKTVKRIAIPSWMAGGITPNDKPTAFTKTVDGWRFELGPRTFVYGRWGLALAT